MIEGKGFTIHISKFDYFFGRVASSPSNQARSLQNLQDLNRLGINEAAGGREHLLQIFEEGLIAPEVERRETTYGITIRRQIQVGGGEVEGAIEVSYLYRNGDLSSIPEVTSIRPKLFRPR